MASVGARQLEFIHRVHGIYSDAVERCIDTACEKGCTAVRALIADLEAGKAAGGIEHLSPTGRASVLKELKAIMAVYDARHD